MKDLKNRIALVTGGSRGIGAAVAIALAKAGADVAVNYRERADAANAVSGEIIGMGRNESGRIGPDLFPFKLTLDTDRHSMTRKGAPIMPVE